MPKAGLFAGEVTPQAPADGAITTKFKGYQWMEYGGLNVYCDVQDTGVSTFGTTEDALVTVDLVTADITTIESWSGVLMNALGVNRSTGDAYFLDRNSLDIYKYTQATEVAENTGVKIDTIDPTPYMGAILRGTDTWYVSATSEVYTVNISTGSLTEIPGLDMINLTPKPPGAFGYDFDFDDTGRLWVQYSTSIYYIDPPYNGGYVLFADLIDLGVTGVGACFTEKDGVLHGQLETKQLYQLDIATKAITYSGTASALLTDTAGLDQYIYTTFLRGDSGDTLTDGITPYTVKGVAVEGSCDSAIAPNVSITLNSGGSCTFINPATSCSTAAGTYEANDSGFTNPANTWLWSIESGAATIVGSTTSKTVVVDTGDTEGQIDFTLKVVATDSVSTDTATRITAYSQFHTDVSPPIVEDTFTDTNGTLLQNHTPDIDTVGSGWVVEQGTPIISNNKVEANGVDTAFIRASIDSGKADVIITCDIEVASETSVQQVILRFTDGDNRWFVQVTANTTGVEDTFVLLERNAATTTVRATTSGFFVVTGQIVTIRVVASGSTISATLDGGNEISYSGATFNQTVTKHGLGLRGDEIRTADNFKVLDNS